MVFNSTLINPDAGKCQQPHIGHTAGWATDPCLCAWEERKGRVLREKKASIVAWLSLLSCREQLSLQDVKQCNPGKEKESFF